MNRCQLCGTDYDLKDVKRAYGGELWRHKYCTPQCYTQAIIASNKKEVENTFTITGGEISWSEFGRQLGMIALTIVERGGTTGEEVKRGICPLLAQWPNDLQTILEGAGITIDAAPGTKVL